MAGAGANAWALQRLTRDHGVLDWRGSNYAGPLLLREFLLGPGHAKTGTISDDFTTEDTALWLASDYAQAAVSASGGQLRIDCEAGYPALGTVDFYDLNESTLTVELVQPPNVGNGTTGTWFTMQATPWDGSIAGQIRFGWDAVNGGELGFIIDCQGDPGNSLYITYNATDHRWLRFRMTGGMVHWETSPDGTTWTTQRSSGTVLDLSEAWVVFQSGFYGTEPTPGTAIWDNLNVAGTDSPPQSGRVLIGTVGAAAAAPTTAVARSTADPLAVVDAPPRVVVAGVGGTRLAPAWTAVHHSVPVLAGDTRPVPVVATVPVQSSAAAPAAVVARSTATPLQPSSNPAAPLVVAPGRTVPTAGPAAIVDRSTADPAVVDTPTLLDGRPAAVTPPAAAPPALVVVSRDTTPLQASSNPASPLVVRIPTLPKTAAAAMLERPTADPVPAAARIPTPQALTSLIRSAAAPAARVARDWAGAPDAALPRGVAASVAAVTGRHIGAAAVMRSRPSLATGTRPRLAVTTAGITTCGAPAAVTLKGLTLQGAAPLVLGAFTSGRDRLGPTSPQPGQGLTSGRRVEADALAAATRSPHLTSGGQ